MAIPSEFPFLWFYHRVMPPKDADRMANSVDPDQTAPLGILESDMGLHCLSIDGQPCF